MWFNHWALSAGQGKNNEVLQAWRPWYLIIKPSPIRALGEVIYFAYVKKGAKLCEPFPHTLLKFHPECGPTERETEGYWGAVRGKDWGGRERERERERERGNARPQRRRPLGLCQSYANPKNTSQFFSLCHFLLFLLHYLLTPTFHNSNPIGNRHVCVWVCECVCVCIYCLVWYRDFSHCNSR